MEGYEFCENIQRPNWNSGENGIKGSQKTKITKLILNGAKFW